MSDDIRRDQRGRRIVERLPHGQWTEDEQGFRRWEPDNPNCFYGEDGETCSRTDEERTER